jgi:tetratricopeptide (TPR) repeat protein
MLARVALAAVVVLGLLGGGWWALARRAPAGAAGSPAAAGEEGRLLQAVRAAPGSGAAHQALGRYCLEHARPFAAIWELGTAHHLQPADESTSLQLAVALASAQLYDAAIEQLEALAARRPPLQEGRIQLATLYLARTEPKQALAVLNEAPDLARWPEGQLAVGRVYEAMGQTRPAVAAYRRARALVPGSAAVAERLGRFLLRSHDLPAARAALEAARLKIGPEPRLLTLLAEAETARGNAAGAERWLRAALATEPSHVPALVALGRLYYRKHRFREALAAFQLALRLAPGDPEANDGLADLLQAAGRAADAHTARARAFRARGLPMRAVEEYEALARLPGQQVPAVLEMTLILLQTQQTARAIRVTEAALAAHPRETALYERLVVLQLLLPDRPAAERRCEEWQRLEPRSARPVWIRGKLAADEGDLTLAARLLEQAAAAEPDNLDYAATLAGVLARGPRRADWERARALFERTTAHSPVDARSLFDFAQLLRRLGEPDEARRVFLRCLEVDPNISEAYVSLVQLARQLRQPEQVALWAPIVRQVEARLRQELLRSRRTWEQPGDPAGHRDLALFLIRTDELRKAESQLEEALRLRPGWQEAAGLLTTVRRAREAL